MSETVLVCASLGDFGTVEAWTGKLNSDVYILCVNTDSGGIFLTKDEVKALIDGLQKLIGE